ncbi:MAG: hypothetical protein AAB671_01970 [Patescibacteria group bacterium]
MIAKVTPLIRLPSSTDVFDYFVPDELRQSVLPGSLVRIPFRASKVAGVVLDVAPAQERTGFRARPVDSVIGSEPVLTASQLALIQEFSAYYFVTRGSVARLMVPERPERASPRSPSLVRRGRGGGNDVPFSVSSSQLLQLKKAAASISSARFLTIQDVSSFVWLLLHLIKQGEQSQLLVLVPTLDMIDGIAGSVHKMCSDELAVIHSRLSLGQYWNAYQNIMAGSARVILSTRQGVFLPIRENSHIIFFDATSEDFKQYDQHPKYDSRIVASWLASITESKLLFASSSEIIAEQRTTPLLFPPARGQKLSVSLVDMKNEMSRRDFSAIAGATLEAIQETLSQHKKAVVIALREEPPLNPPLGKGGRRGGVSVKSILEILTQELKNCKVSASEEQFQVLVATPRVLEGLKLSSERSSLGLLVCASIEPMLAIPDYRSPERVYYRLKHWQMLAQELGFGRIILQSYSPDSLAVRAFAYGEFEAFAADELASRRELSYPPFSKLVKLSYRGKDGKAAGELKRRLPNATGPFTDHSNRQSLLIKLPPNAQLPDLWDVSPDWAIDRDPENVL